MANSRSNKYGANPVTVDGIRFDSSKEAVRYKELKLMERAGMIKDLKRQVEYVLIPSQYAGGKCVERKCSYIADFTYTDSDDQLVVEDVKGFRDPASAAYAKYVIKRKLMLYKYKIRIKEVT